MKELLFGLFLVVYFSVFSINGELDGKKFSRSVTSDGMFRQRAGTRLHCISFKGGNDNVNIFLSILLPLLLMLLTVK